MTVNLSIKEVPEALAERLRERAARHHRSLQGELMAIIEAAAAEGPWGTAPAHEVPQPGGRRWLQGGKSLDELCAERRAAGWQPHPSLARAPLAVDIVRADREAR